MELVMFGDRPLTTAAFLAGTGPDSLVIDTIRLTYASPLDLAGAVAAAHWAAESAMRVEFVLPTDPNVASYLQRMDVLRLMPERTRIKGQVRTQQRADLRDSLLEVTALTARTVDDLTERIGPMVTNWYRSRSRTAGPAVFRACSELISNAAEHGDSTRGAFVAAQLHTGATTEYPRLEFAVCDTGVGILQHLKQNPKHAHLTRDEIAIAKALKAGVSGIDLNGRGNGLSDAVEHARRDGNLQLQLRSGRGEVRVVADPDHHAVKRLSRRDQTGGTWAWLTHHLR